MRSPNWSIVVCTFLCWCLLYAYESRDPCGSWSGSGERVGLQPQYLFLRPVSAAPAVGSTDQPQPNELTAVTAAGVKLVEQPNKSTLPNLQVAWWDWSPCYWLRELALEFPAAQVEVLCLQFSDTYVDTFDIFRSQTTKPDLIALDSQFITEAVEKDYVVELTDLYQSNPTLLEDMLPAALHNYAESPAGSQRYWGLPLEPDVLVMAYRKDLWSAAGFKLPKGTRNTITWDEFTDYAEYFGHHPELLQSTQKTSNTTCGGTVTVDHAGHVNIVGYGGFSTFFCGSKCYDEVSTLFNTLLWCFGGDLWNEQTYHVEGSIDSPQAQRAIKTAERLFNAGPMDPHKPQWTFGDDLNAICQGHAASVMTWFALASPLLDTVHCPHAADLEFAMVPKDEAHWLQLGGQPLTINKFSTQHEVSRQFIEWFLSDPIQLKWINYGGFTARQSILQTKEFISAKPYNYFFLDSFKLIRDFWHKSEYIDLLSMEQYFIQSGVIGRLDSDLVLGLLANQQQALLQIRYPTYFEPVILYLTAGVTYPFIALAVLLCVCNLVLFLIVLYYRRHECIRAHSWSFCFIMILGGMMSNGIEILYGITSTQAVEHQSQAFFDRLCQSKVFLYGYTYLILFLPLIVKTRRLLTIFGQKQIKFVNLPDSYLFIQVGVVLGIYTIFGIIWQAVNPMYDTLTSIDADTVMHECTCENYSIWIGVMYSFLGYFLLYGLVIAIQSRKLPDTFREAKEMEAAIYNIFVVSIHLIPILLLVRDKLVVSFLLEIICVMFCSSVTLMIMFIPNVIKLLSVTQRTNFIGRTCLVLSGLMTPIPSHQEPTHITTTPPHTNATGVFTNMKLSASTLPKVGQGRASTKQPGTPTSRIYHAGMINTPRHVPHHQHQPSVSDQEHIHTESGVKATDEVNHHDIVLQPNPQHPSHHQRTGSTSTTINKPSTIRSLHTSTPQTNTNAATGTTTAEPGTSPLPVVTTPISHSQAEATLTIPNPRSVDSPSIAPVTPVSPVSPVRMEPTIRFHIQSLNQLQQYSIEDSPSIQLVQVDQSGDKSI